MAGSGLVGVFETVFATNEVGHIMSGKAYSRAVRWHLLANAALNTLLVAETFSVPQILFSTEVESNDNSDECVTENMFSFDDVEMQLRGGQLEEDMGNKELNSAKKKKKKKKSR